VVHIASGDLLGTIYSRSGTPPAAAFATNDQRVGTNITVDLLDFDDTTDESIFFLCHMPDNYAGGGLTITIEWMATSATTGTVSLDISLMSITDDADDVDTKAFAAANNINPTTASATGEVDYAPVTFTDGADMDSVAAGEDFFLKFTRDANGTTSTDDMTGDLELVKITIKET